MKSPSAIRPPGSVADGRGRPLGLGGGSADAAAFYCTNMQRLRLLALSAKSAFVADASMAGLTPVLTLHLNLYCLMQVRERLLARAAVALASPGKTEPLGTVRPVDRFVLEHRVARMQSRFAAAQDGLRPRRAP